METYVALLRGVNVGGKHPLKMRDLRDAVEAVGGSDVSTYIQSGNAVFRHEATGADALATRLGAAVARSAGFPVPVTLRTAAEWRAVVEANPFPDADPAYLHVTFFAEPLAPTAFAHVDAGAYAPEASEVRGRERYLFLPNGIGRSKLATLRPAGAAGEGTTRNWRTVLALLELAEGR